MVEGHIEQNPVGPIRTPKIEVKRERLRLGVYNAPRAIAEQLSPWFPLSMDPRTSDRPAPGRRGV